VLDATEDFFVAGGSPLRGPQLILCGVGSIMPDLVGEVAAEEASHFFCPRILSIEEPARSEVVDSPAG
jgi:hypothetical protein